MYKPASTYNQHHPLMKDRIKTYQKSLKKLKRSNACSTWPCNPITLVRMLYHDKDIENSSNGGLKVSATNSTSNKSNEKYHNGRRQPEGYVDIFSNEFAVVRSLPNTACIRDPSIYRTTANNCLDPRTFNQHEKHNLKTEQVSKRSS